MIETTKLEEILEKIDDYWCEYIGCDISFMKKGVLFISEFLPLIDFGNLPVSQEDIDAQLKNIKGDDDIFLEISKELNKKNYQQITEYRKQKNISDFEKALSDLLSTFFIADFEYEDLIITYACYELLKLGISENLIIEKLYKHFGDILSNAQTIS